MTYCDQCGAAVRTDARYCPACGVSLPNGPPLTDGGAAESPLDGPSETPTGYAVGHETAQSADLPAERRHDPVIAGGRSNTLRPFWKEPLFIVAVVLALTLIPIGIAIARSLHESRRRDGASISGTPASADATAAPAASALQVSTPADLAKGLNDRGVPCSNYQQEGPDVISGSAQALCDSGGASLNLLLGSYTGYEDSSFRDGCGTGTVFKIAYVNGPGWSIAVTNQADLSNPVGQWPTDPGNVAADVASTIASATGGTTRAFTSSDCSGKP